MSMFNESDWEEDCRDCPGCDRCDPPKPVCSSCGEELSEELANAVEHGAAMPVCEVCQ